MVMNIEFINIRIVVLIFDALAQRNAYNPSSHRGFAVNHEGIELMILK